MTSINTLERRGADAGPPGGRHPGDSFGEALLANAAAPVAPAAWGLQQLLQSGANDVLRALAGGARILTGVGPLGIGVVLNVLLSAEPVADGTIASAWINTMTQLADEHAHLELVRIDGAIAGLRDTQADVVLIVPDSAGGFRLNRNHPRAWIEGRLAGEPAPAAAADDGSVAPSTVGAAGTLAPERDRPPEVSETRRRALSVMEALTRDRSPAEGEAIEAALIARYQADVASGARGSEGGSEADFTRFLADLYNEAAGWTRTARDILADASGARRPDPLAARFETVETALYAGMTQTAESAMQEALAARYDADVARGARGAQGATQRDYMRFVANLFGADTGWTRTAADIQSDARDILVERALGAAGVADGSRAAYREAILARMDDQLSGATAAQALNWLANLPASPATWSEIAGRVADRFPAISDVDPRDIGNDPTGVRPDLPTAPSPSDLEAPPPIGERPFVTDVFGQPPMDPGESAAGPPTPPRDTDGLAMPHTPPMPIDGPESALPSLPDDLSQADAEAIEAAVEAATERAALNPVTPSVYGEQTLDVAIREAQQRGADIAVLLADLNTFSTYNELLGAEAGDEAIGIGSDALNAAATRLNALYADLGVAFVPVRKAGDEMALVATFDPARTDATDMPPAVAKDMLRVFAEELQAYNAASAIPVPTSTASAAVLAPDAYAGERELHELLDRIDHAGVAALNAAGGAFTRNGGVYVDAVTGETQLLLGPTYTPPEGAALGPFRATQGSQPWTEGGDVANLRVGPWARPTLTPGAASDLPLPTVPLPATVARALRDVLVPDAASPIEALNGLRAATSLEGNFRALHADGIAILDQPTALARLDGMLQVARAQGGDVTLEFFEPRGLKEVNDHGFYEVDGRREAVSHGGGNVVIEQMVRANHAAAVAVFGEDYANDVMTFRDRGKRFGNVFSPDVTPEQIAAFQERRDEIYAGTPALYGTASGESFPIRLADPDGGSHAFVFDLGYAGLRVSPSEDADLDARALRDRLAAPLGTDAQSILDLGKLVADGQLGRDAALALIEAAGFDTPDVFLPPSQTVEENQRELY